MAHDGSESSRRVAAQQAADVAAGLKGQKEGDYSRGSLFCLRFN